MGDGQRKPRHSRAIQQVRNRHGSPPNGELLSHGSGIIVKLQYSQMALPSEKPPALPDQYPE
jgi:hypothetical protein